MSDETILIFGVDGCNPGVVRELTREGVMENFADLQYTAERSYGRFKSYTNEEMEVPHTGPCWTSMYTGLKPEEHGLTQGGWEEGDSKFGELYTIWDAISESGYTLAMCGMPMTYPAKDINGWMAAGFVAASDKDTYKERGVSLDEASEYVETIADTNATHVAGHLLEHGASPDQHAPTGWTILQQAETKRVSAFISECERQDEEYDVVAYGTTLVDKMGHINGINHDDEYTEKSYEVLDDILGELLEAFDPDEVVIVSDHGFSGFNHTLYGYYLSTICPMESIFDFVDNIEHKLDVTKKQEYGPIEDDDKKEGLTEEEKEKVKDRLKEHGYIS